MCSCFRLQLSVHDAQLSATKCNLVFTTHNLVFMMHNLVFTWCNTTNLKHEHIERHRCHVFNTRKRKCSPIHFKLLHGTEDSEVHGISISLASDVGCMFDEPGEAGLWFELERLMNTINLKPMLKIPFKQWCADHDVI